MMEVYDRRSDTLDDIWSTSTTRFVYADTPFSTVVFVSKSWIPLVKVNWTVKDVLYNPHSITV
jgi:hypothetical protein